MRIASAHAYDSAIYQLQLRQEGLTKTQEQLTSGKRVLKPSDDPASAAEAERALAVTTRSIARQRALDASMDAMQLAESALGEAGNLHQQMREQLIAAGNGSYTDAERKVLAESLRGLRNDLLAVANRSDGAGRYLFGGQGSDQQPFIDTPAGVAFQGTAGQLLAASGEVSPLSLDGRAAFLQAPNPAIPGTTISIFDVLDKAVLELNTPGRTPTQIAQTVSESLGGIDAGAANLSAWRANAGELLNRIEGQGARLSQIAVDAKRQRSDAEDLDMVAAISEFKSRETGYDAALKAYSIVQKLSLFDYVR
jgi:flagellar hook-associated protein 3 FlgL